MIPTLRPSCTTIVLSTLASILIAVVLLVNMMLGENREVYGDEIVKPARKETKC